MPVPIVNHCIATRSSGTDATLIFLRPQSRAWLGGFGMMDIVFLQDTQLRARSAACRYGAVRKIDVNFLNNGSYP